MRWATVIAYLLPGAGGGRHQCLRLSSAASLPQDLSLSEDILYILETLPSAAAIESSLNSLAPLLSPSSISLALSSAPSLPSAFLLFAWSSRHRALRSFRAHNLVISFLLRDAPSSFSSFWSSLSELRSSSILVHPYAFAALISAYSTAGFTEKAVEAFNRMPEFASRPNTFTYNTLLNILAGKGMILLAMSVYNQMIKSDCLPNSSTYTILIHGLCKAGKIDEALRLFDEMLQRGIAPKTTVYTVILSLLCCADRADDAIKQLQSMKENKCHLDEIACNALLSGLCQIGRIDQAFNQLKLFQVDGFVLGLNGYSCLIDGLFRARRFEEACGFYHEMLKNSIRPDCILYTIMIRGHAEAGRIEEAFEFFNEMTIGGLVPDTYCYNTLIKGLCDAGLLDRARSLKLEISQNGCFPDSATFSILICGLCKEGLIHEAQKIFDDMGKAGCFPTVMTFNSLISGLCKAGKMEEAQLLFYKMEMGTNPYLFFRLSQGPEQVHNITTLQGRIRELCMSGDILKAYKLLCAIINSGVAPDVVTYNILINGMCKAGKIKQALKLLEELQTKGHFPDAITYGTLIDGLSRLHRDNDVSELLEHMLKNGCKPSVSIYNTQMRTLTRRRQTSKAVLLWLDYISHEKTNSEEAETICIARKHFEEGCFVEAVRTLFVLERNQGSANSFPYTIWLIGLCQEWKIDEALGIFTLLREFDIEATPPSCALLINYLCRTGKLGSALDVMLYSLRKGFLFMKPVGNRLLRRLCLRNKMKDAHELVHRMNLAGYNMDLYLRKSTKALLHPY
ncbi:pentatricopeptide repeat-containing protein At1g79540 [Phalaenopsis equestris]|uniref:pentatricopeptide repeat-containing protein At1g79540 n=1 Tax=Phalaenopsis equestris TaxID=78828 RepID=UPI0009E27F7C|nr:pentatricopeptide repeat-containing protein At1g79540 [Phalaenopsis equestris]